MEVYSVKYGEEEAFVCVEKPRRGPTKISTHWLQRPSKEFEVLLSPRKKIEKLLKLK